MTVPLTHYFDKDKQTICAVATPPGYGGLSVIRVSGSNALAIVQKLVPSLTSIESHRCVYKRLINRDGQVIDEVIVTYFQKGKSFTAEETIEISCHGNPVICNAILNELVFYGARHADKGEFTYRAFLNGRIDLAQAEAVLDVIQATNENSAKKALRSLEGNLSKEIHSYEDQLTWCLAHIEAGIDFSTEGLEVIEDILLIEKLSTLSEKIEKLKANFQISNQIRHGVRVALIGEPNVGKSSLLNYFLLKDRAIVSAHAGTTRDVVEGEVLFNNLKFCFVDTAGIRQSENEIEKIGIQKSLQEKDNADFIFYVFDAFESLQRILSGKSLDIKSEEILFTKNSFIILNKEDLLSAENKILIKNHFKVLFNIEEKQILLTSTVPSGELHSQRNNILKILFQAIEFNKTIDNDFVFLNQRQFEQLTKTQENLQRALLVLNSKIGAEFVALELKEALMALQQLIGKVFDDQIMDRVFKEFCIGK